MRNGTFAHAVSKCGITTFAITECKFEFAIYLPHWQTWVNATFRAVVVKETAYMRLVRPSLENCSSFWDTHTLTNIKLEMVQRRAARFVVNDHNRDSTVSDTLSKLKWPSLQIRRKNSRLAQMFKIINNLSAISHNDCLTRPLLNLLPGENTTWSSLNTSPSLTVSNTHSSQELSLNGIL